ncbi:branched-chain amino acid ABC transporter permease [Alcanivorax sp. S71-1-4]|uniref:branched-chain amino acid ABC transporter permease n=1 Tax=Alcanivorax sp. S71-1-4 TaxID=1177159 RepID=UPI00135B8093|nr:branched-chain amino acid ABC transporter permease [Alcanivorax sp. S71-1-4]KAF0805643.1 branched-chain amino acid ABC transporter permease [Alcanivorax sp. S71-1-4]
MDWYVFTFLTQDGLTTGAIYALIALALVLVFAVTRVILVGQGDFVTLSALTLATLQAGKTPATVWLLLGGASLVCVKMLAAAAREGRLAQAPRILLMQMTLPCVLALVCWLVEPATLPGALKVLLSIVIIAPLGPVLYRLVYQPVAQASVLQLLIISVAIHIAVIGISLWIFGAEGFRTLPFTSGNLDLGEVSISLQSVLVIGIALALIVALYLFFGHTLYGKALRATAFNQRGAQLVGVPTDLAGSHAFLLAAIIGAVSGILIGPITTLYYDSGFLITLKGFVAAIIGGMASYPLAAAGAFLVGLLESFASFWVSAYKEVIVFTLVLPVLLWLSLTTHHVEEEQH